MLSQPRGHSTTERIISMRNSIDTFGKRIRDLPTCSAVPQPTAPPCASFKKETGYNMDTTTQILPFYFAWIVLSCRMYVGRLRLITGLSRSKFESCPWVKEPPPHSNSLAYTASQAGNCWHALWWPSAKYSLSHFNMIINTAIPIISTACCATTLGW